MLLYTQQTGCYPPGESDFGLAGIPRGAAVWPTILRAYLNGQRQPFLCPERDERFAWSANPINAIGPATPAFERFGYALGEPLLDHELTPFSYGYNAGGGGSLGLGTSFGLSGFNQENTIQYIPVGQVRAPDDMVAIADSSGFDFKLGNFNLFLWPRQYSAYGLPGAVHFGGCNVLFCDGHVEWYAQQDITLPVKPNWDEPRVQNVARKWSRYHTVFPH